MKTKWLTTVATVGLMMVAVNLSAVAGQPTTGGDARSVSVAEQHSPPPRPLPLTVEQVDALEQMAMQPEYRIDPDTRAAFSPETQKKITEASAPGFYAGFFGGLIWMLVAAAPL